MPYHDPLTEYAVTKFYGSTQDITALPIEEQIKHWEKVMLLNSSSATLDWSEKDKATALEQYQLAEQRLARLNLQKQGSKTPLALKSNNSANPYKKAAFYLLGAGAAAVSYSRSKSLLRAFGASIVSVPYLIYVAIETHKEKQK